ncbi:viral a-type inclusion [Pyrenophora seminiperda CCB06]|uniref:Viral a-type inclusion n=1 Tax=Pyrenophora seminiperda CCB06 TaxID=1302712 RepID=A0A3M7MGM1_9PLEO|nr:viral a-type inclusion [Pyrenophora seminiperda CCB06]
MAATMEADIEINYEMKDLQHSLRNATLQLSLERSKHLVEAVAKDEEIRKLRVAQCLLQDDNSDLHEQLEEEQARSDELESALDDALAQLDERHADGETAQNTIRTQAREIANLRAELKAMENVTSDSNKILSDKLALSREIASLRPEVEHLRAQVEANTGLLSEKLALQRQLATLQVELENEKRTAARTLAKQGKKMEQDEEVRNELDEARKQLATERRDRMRVEAGLTEARQEMESAEQGIVKVQADLVSREQIIERLQAEVENLTKKQANKASKRDKAHDAAIEELRQELEQERAARLHAEKASKDISAYDAVIAQLQQELEQEKRERQKAEKASKKGPQQTDAQVEAVRKELDEERRERKKQEREYTKTLAELQGRNTILDDKLSAFREKLRTTKEKLKEKEAKLERVDRAETAPPAKTSSTAAAKTSTKNSRKRVAATAEPETMLGTPGDGFPAKKMKRGTSVSAVGDTSTFSLTPFLNRASNVAAASPIVEEEEEEEEEEQQETIPEQSTPTAPPKKASKKAAQPKVKALAPAASSKANAKPRKKNAAAVLEMVTEEVSEASHSTSKEDSENGPTSIPLKDNDGPSKKSGNGASKVKPRKSLMSFATFAEEPAAEKKKKRKLGASAGKTLFDAEDAEDVAPLKPVGISKGLFAARALGKSVLGKQGQQRPISGGFNMMSEEAFTFSPLKKDRRGASILK